METKQLLLREVYDTEVLILACSILNPLLPAPTIALNYNSIKHILSVVKAKELTYPLTFSSLKARDEPEYKAIQDADDRCHILIEKYGKDNVEIISRIYYSALTQLKISNYKINVVDTMQASLGKIENGNVREALVTLKTIPHLEDKEAQDSSIDLAMTLLDDNDNFRSGIDEIDKAAGLRKRNVIAIAADTGSQKTTWTVWFIIQIMIENPNFTCVFFSKEMDKKEIVMKMVTYFTAIETQKMMSVNIILDPVAREAERARMYAEIKEEITNNELFRSVMNRFHVLGPSDFNNASDIALTIEMKRPDIWCLDFLTLLGEGNHSGASTDSFMSEQMKILKEITVANNSFGIIIAQLKHNTIDSRTYKVPNKSDIEYGKQLKQQAYQIYMLFSPGLYYTEEIVNVRYFFVIGQKSRYGTNLTLPFLSYPSRNNYTTPEYEKGEMLRWLKTYEKETNSKR